MPSTTTSILNIITQSQYEGGGGGGAHDGWVGLKFFKCNNTYGKSFMGKLMFFHLVISQTAEYVVHFFYLNF